MDSVVKVTIYIIVGATIIALVQSGNTSSTISSITGGFANILTAMRGSGGSATNQNPNTGQRG